MASAGLAGLEWAVGLPGTLGGAVTNNAGAHGGEMSASFFDATLVLLDGTPRAVYADEMAYRYRHSAVKDGTLRGLLTTIRVRLAPGDADALRAKAVEYHDWRKTAQPQAASAGSMFQNPPGDAAGRLIEACGLKGFTIGQAQVSPVHANFLVNLGKATAADVLAVGDHCRQCVCASGSGWHCSTKSSALAGGMRRMRGTYDNRRTSGPPGAQTPRRRLIRRAIERARCLTRLGAVGDGGARPRAPMRWCRSASPGKASG